MVCSPGKQTAEIISSAQATLSSVTLYRDLRRGFSTWPASLQLEWIGFQDCLLFTGNKGSLDNQPHLDPHIHVLGGQAEIRQAVQLLSLMQVKQKAQRQNWSTPFPILLATY